jgi:hypothetical protein
MANPVELSNAYDRADDMLKIKSMQKNWRSDFAGAVLNPAKWDVLRVAAGQTVTVGGGVATVALGTIVDVDTVIVAKETFTAPMRAMIGLALSQRLAANEVYLEFFSVDPITGLDDGDSVASWKLTGTTVTQGIYEVTNGAMPKNSSAPSTIVTTATNDILEIEVFPDEVWFHSRAMDSSAGRTNSYVRQQSIPDPNKLYKFRIRAKNNAVAGSNTNLSLLFVSVIDYAELTAEITAGRGSTVAGQAIASQVTGGNLSGNQNVGGAAAHDSPVSGNPVRLAGRALNANYATVSTGDTADLVTTLAGALIQKPFSIPELDWQFQQVTPVADTADKVLKAAGAAGIRNFITGLQVKNINAVPTEIVIKDGATVIWRGHLSANMLNADSISFAIPLHGTAATALNFACITTGASVYVSAQGYQAP